MIVAWVQQAIKRFDPVLVVYESTTLITLCVCMQDIMRLDNSARMNTPGKAAGNWAWRVGGVDVWQQLEQEAADLRRLAYVYDRLPKGVEVDY